MGRDEEIGPRMDAKFREQIPAPHLRGTGAPPVHFCTCVMEIKTRMGEAPVPFSGLCLSSSIRVHSRSNSSVPSLTADTLRSRANSVDPFACGDEEQVAVLAAEADVAGPVFANLDVQDLFARFVKAKTPWLVR